MYGHDHAFAPKLVKIGEPQITNFVIIGPRHLKISKYGENTTKTTNFDFFSKISWNGQFMSQKCSFWFKTF